MNENGLKFVDLFAGCGGMTLGLMQAGWKGLFAIEKNPMAFETIKANFLSTDSTKRRLRLDWPDYLAPEAVAIENLQDTDLKEHLHGKLDLVAGGPPCQGFSFSGRRNENDARNALVEAYAAFVLKVQPTLLLIENVPGILVPHGKKRHDASSPKATVGPVKSYAQRLSTLLTDKYVFRGEVVDAADFGVPQRRLRFFGVGILRDALPKGVNVVDGCVCTNGVPDLKLDPFEWLRRIRGGFLKRHQLRTDSPVTAEEAIGDLSTGDIEATRTCNDTESPSGFSELDYSPPSRWNATSYVRLMRKGLNPRKPPNSLRLARHTPKVRERFTEILKHCRRGVRLSDEHRSRYSTLKHRIVPLAGDQPAHTLTTLPDDLIHYSRPRILTVRECARLQSFPDWFEFRGKYTTGGTSRRSECPRYTQVGNAVPPLLAEAWGVALQRLLNEIRRRHSAGPHC